MSWHIAEKFEFFSFLLSWFMSLAENKILLLSEIVKLRWKYCEYIFLLKTFKMFLKIFYSTLNGSRLYDLITTIWTNVLRFLVSG